MNEKVQNVLNKVDVVADKMEFLPRLADRLLGFLKMPVIAGIPPLVTKICSRFGGASVALFALIFSVFCFKNAIISCFYENGSAGEMFGYAIGAIVFIVVAGYVIQKMDGIFDKIIKTTPSRISSKNIFLIFAFLALVGSVLTLLAGLDGLISSGDIGALVAGLVASAILILVAIFSISFEDFSITEDENASAGEDFVAIYTFIIKLCLRLIPILVFVLPIVGVFNCIPEIFDTYTESYGDVSRLDSGEMYSATLEQMIYLVAGIIPLLAYFYYLGCYVVLDLIRAVLSLPHKLDEIIKK